jgi:hypothetical protein
MRLPAGWCEGGSPLRKYRGSEVSPAVQPGHNQGHDQGAFTGKARSTSGLDHASLLRP